MPVSIKRPAFYCLFGISASYLSFCFLGISLRGENRYCTFIIFAFVEVNHTVCKCIKCVVLSLSNILTGIMLITTLANDDVSSDNLLTTPNLNA